MNRNLRRTSCALALALTACASPDLRRESPPPPERVVTSLVRIAPAPMPAAATNEPQERRVAPRARSIEPRAPSLAQQLRQTRVTNLVTQNEESLRSVIDLIRIQTGLPLVVHPAAEEAALDAGVVFDLNLENPVSVRQALNLITEMAGDEIGWTIRHDAVIVTTRVRAQANKEFRIHDVRSLTFARTDFRGPRIDRLRLLDDLEDDDGGGPFGGVGEAVTELTVEDLMTLVQENVAVGTWDDDGVSIEAENGLLYVRHTPDVQVSVARFLGSLGGG